MEGGTELLSARFLEAYSSHSIFAFTTKFTFPKKDIYNIVVKGDPKIPNSFQAFNINYDLRFVRDDGLPTASSLSHLTHSEHFLHYIIFGGALIPIGIVYLNERRKLKKKGL